MLVIDQLKFSEFGASIFFQLSWQWQALPGLLLTRTTVIVFSSHNTQKKLKLQFKHFNIASKGLPFHAVFNRSSKKQSRNVIWGQQEEESSQRGSRREVCSGGGKRFWQPGILIREESEYVLESWNDFQKVML